MHYFLNGSELRLGDTVEMELHGHHFLATVVYAEGLGAWTQEYAEFEKWDPGGVVIRWHDPQLVKPVLFPDGRPLPPNVENFLMLSDRVEVELTLITRAAD